MSLAPIGGTLVGTASITQKLNVVAGEWYEVSLLVGSIPKKPRNIRGNPNVVIGGPATVTVRANASFNEWTKDCTSTPSGDTIQWEECVFRFEWPSTGGAIGPDQAITLQAANVKGQFIGVDYVSLYRLKSWFQ